METRANYVLIGAFALAGFAGLLAFFLWFANLQIDRSFAYYDVDFDSVSGLSDASDVRFAGLPVGQVVDVGLSPENDGRVRVRVEIDAETPVRTDSVATIEPQGVTGVAYVGISPGSPEAPLLAEASNADVPRIEAGQSVLQSLSETAPAVLNETLAMVQDLRALVGGENQQRIDTILANAERSSEAFAEALDSFTSVSGTVADFAREIDRFNATLDTLTRDASGVFDAVETSLGQFDALAEEARAVVSLGSGTVEAAEAYLRDDLGPATQQLERSLAEIEAQAARLGDSADGLIATYREAGEVATARLTEAEETIAAANEMIASMDAASVSVADAATRVDDLIVDGAEPLVAELRVATEQASEVLARLGEAAGTDLPAVMADIRAAAAGASETVAQVGQDLSSASDRLDALSLTATETLASVQATFENANDTLSAINAALETGQGALDAAERAFDGADRVLNEDVSRIVDQLTATLDQLETTVGAVADQIPGVTEDLRAASRSAEAAFAGIERTVSRSAPAFTDFAATALPQYTRLATETRALIENLDALVEQIRRDPSRFFLDPRAPEYRR